MDQHPVPQNISSYEFRLVGDMTLKQFFQLAGGALLGFVFFKMPLPFFLKWPLVILSVILGVMLAFIPVSGRPFSQWLLAFIKAIYSPTEFTWYATAAEPMDKVVSDSPQKPASALDNLETQVFSRVSQLLQPATKNPPAAPAPFRAAEIAPQPQVITLDEPAVSTQPTFSPPPNNPSVAPTPPIRLVVSTETHTIAEHTSSAPAISAPDVSDLPPAPFAAQINTPASTPVYSSHDIPMPPPLVPQTPAPPAPLATNLPSPERPNIVTGVVMQNGQPIEGAIVEVLNSTTGIPVRALRSNKLGQFQTATPLSSGAYNIVTEKDDKTFDPVSIICDGKVLSPILISAHP